MTMKRFSYALLAAAVLLGACARQECSGKLDPRDFEGTVNGKKTALYTLSNAQGMEVDITNFGGRIVAIRVPDKDGRMQDVVLGFDNIKDYVHIPSDFGACIGRYANRICHGQIEVAGRVCQLDTNNFGHTLHGGPTGWQYQVYDVVAADEQSLSLQIVSPDGDNGFPGKVVATCTYTLEEDNALQIQYHAVSDAPTVINMTNHSYFNLHGDPSKDVLDHLLWLNATQFTPVDSSFMTLGVIADIPAKDVFDFYTAPKPIGKDIGRPHQQLAYGRGYDHNWVLRSGGGDAVKHAASLYSPQSGIRLDVYTTEPGIQVYSGNFLDGSVRGKYGISYEKRHAVCLETQKYPNSPNNPSWPSPLLEPEKPYSSATIFRFSVE